MAGNAELGKQFLEDVFGQLPESLRGRASELLSSPEAQAALERVGSRVSPLDDERQQLTVLKTQLDTRDQQLTEWHGKLNGWATSREKEFAERDKALKAREANPNPQNPQHRAHEEQPPTRGTETTMTKEEIAKHVADFVAPREGAFVDYVAKATNYSAFHLKNFNEPLDVDAIVRHPDIAKLGFQGVYEHLHQDKLADMKQKAKVAEREALKDELRKELQQQTPVDMPYPLGEGSPLDALLMDTDKRPKGDPVAAARMYESLVNAGAGAR